YLELHVLVSGWVTRKPTPTQPQLLARLCPGRDSHLDRPTERWHRDTPAKSRLPRSHREGERHITALECEGAVRQDVYLEVQVAGAAAVRGRLALSGKPDELPFRHAGGDRDAHRVRVQLHRAVGFHLGTLQLEHP